MIQQIVTQIGRAFWTYKMAMTPSRITKAIHGRFWETQLGIFPA